MKLLRRSLGVFVMIAGIIGLVLSLAGIGGLITMRPKINASLSSTIDLLVNSLDTSRKALGAADLTIGAAVTSVDALSSMLTNTANTVSDTQPIITQMNEVLGTALPNTLQAASDSLVAAGDAAGSVEVAIKSFEIFKIALGAIPFVGSAVPESKDTYNPQPTLADSLVELSDSLKGMPELFENMSANIDVAESNLDLVKTDLETMSTSVATISTSLEDYELMIGDSLAAMDNLSVTLTNLQNNSNRIINLATIVLGLFLVWLLATQVVIFSQGWELFHGTAGRMSGGTTSEVEEARGEVLSEAVIEEEVPLQDLVEEDLEENPVALSEDEDLSEMHDSNE